MLLVLFAPFALRADEIIVGNGTDSGNMAPFGNAYGHQWVEMVYPSSMIGQACTITSLSYNCTTVGQTFTSNEIKVYLAESTKTTMTAGSFTPEAELTLVYTGTNVTLGDTEWETLVLDTPFEYSGNNSLVVVFSNNNGGQTNLFLKWACSTVSNSIMFDWNDSNSIGAQFPSSECAMGGNGYAYNKLPNMKINASEGGEEPEPEPTPDPEVAQYRIKSNTTGKYLNVFNNDKHNEGEYGGVGVADLDEESNAQIFTMEDAGNGQIYLLSADGYYVKCWAWNVDAYSTIDRSALSTVDQGNGTYRIQFGYTYFKVEYNAAGGEYFVFSDCNGSNGTIETWTIEAIETEEPDPTPDPEPETNVLFADDFNDGELDGWRVFENDNDGLNWGISDGELFQGVDGTGCIYSETYSGGELYPDNYIVTTTQYTIAENSTISWDVKSDHQSYCAEHYAFIVSSDNTNWTIVFEETITAEDFENQKTIDLADYAGQSLYIGFRHFNCDGYDADGLLVDNVVLTGDGSTEPIEPIVPANELVIGNGTEATNVVPFRASNKHSFTESIYASSEFNGAITINSISYNHNQYVKNYVLTDVRIYMGETSMDAHTTGWVPEEDLTLVYTGANVTIGEEDWETFVLDTPFAYSGNENLVIAVAKSATTTDYVEYYYTEFTSNVSMYVGGDDVSYAQYPTTSGYTNKYRPNIKITYTEGGEIDPEPEVAEGDTWQDAIEVTEYPFSHTPDFANLNNNYTLPGEEQDGKDVVYKLTLAEETTIAATVNGANGKVALYAEDFNGEDNPGTDNYYGANETPDNPDTTTSFFFDFNDGSLEGWESLDADADTYEWEVSDGVNYTGSDGTKCLYSKSTSLTPNNYVYTTEVYAISENSTLTFEAKANSMYYDDYYSVVISEDGEFFLTIWEETAPKSYTNNTVDLSYYAGKNLHIGFRHYNSNQCSGILIDNVKLEDGTTDPEIPEDGEYATTFSYDFNNQSLEDFTLIDADGDNYDWIMYVSAYGIDGGACIASYSYSNDTYLALTPDNYIVTKNKYAITENSEVSFKVSCSYEEHYGVAVSTDGTNFTTIFEETYKDNSGKLQTVSLSEYAGQNVYIALRHFDCTDGYFILVDNYNLTAEEDEEEPEGGIASFTEDFNDGIFNDVWRVIDSDGDGHNWRISSSNALTGPDGSKCISSDSWNSSNLTPNNFIVTLSQYSINETSSLSWNVAPSNPNYYGEHYGIVVSSDNENWTVVFEETLTYMTEFADKTLSLSEYAGQSLYIGLRHFDCSGFESICVDNIQLSSSAKRGNRANSLEETLPAGTYYLVASATEAFSVNINTVGGEQEEPELLPVAQVIATENGANVDVEWSMESSRVLSQIDRKGNVRYYENKRDASDYTFHSYKLYRANGDNEPIVLAENLTETTFEDATWAEAEAGSYKWGVAAMYTANAKREVTTVLSENFDEVDYYTLPEGWTTYSDSQSASEYSHWATSYGINSFGGPYSGVHCAFASGGYSFDASFYLVTPALDLSSSINISADFKYMAPGIFESAGNTLSLVYSESATGPWTELWVKEDAGFTEWTGATVDLSACSGKVVYLAFVTKDLGSFGAGIDDVVVTAEATDGPIPVASEIVWSNTIEKDMTTTVDITVATADGGSVAGTVVTLTNVNEPTYVYEATLDETGYYEWTEFRKGTYEYTISLDGYVSVTEVIIDITQPTSINHTLELQPELIDGLYVSPTAWAMWEAEGDNVYDVLLEGETVADDITETYYQLDVTGLVEGEVYKTAVIINNATTEVMEYEWTYSACSNFAGVVNLTATADENGATLTWNLPVYENTDPVYTFSTNFDNGSLAGWINVDANNDGHVWMNTSEFSNNGLGVENTYCALSMSYDNTYGAIAPDNYLVTDKKYTITEGSKLLYVISAHSRTYDEEHYGVAVSTTGTNPEDFTVIFEETLSAGEADYEGDMDGQWYNMEIDLSAYAGQQIYIAFRHFDCYDMAWLKLDNVELTSSRESKDGQWLQYHNGINELALGFMTEIGGPGLPINWAIMFPADVISNYAGTCITKVSTYVYEGHQGGFSIHVGGDTAPGTAVHTQSYDLSSYSYETVEIELTNPVQISGTENVWIQFSNTTGTYVASYTADCGDPNARWISDNGGSTWYDASYYGEGWYGSWQISAYVDGEATPLPDEPEEAQAEVLGAMIYRDGELLTEQPLNTETYVDTEVSEGDHTYEVRVVYGGETSDTYYAMSCADEVTVSFTTPIEVVEPYDLEGEYTYNEDGTFGATLNWVYPYTICDHFNIYRSTSNSDYVLVGKTEEGFTYFDEVEEGTYYYQVTAVNVIDGEEYESVPALAKGSETQDYVIVDVNTINEIGVNGLKVYPNPTQDNVNIFAENMTRITISNTLGQIVYNQEVDSDNEIINMSQYEAGVYSVRITTENGVIVQRITVVK